MSNERTPSSCEHADTTWSHCQNCPGQIVIHNADGTADRICPGGLKVVEALRKTLEQLPSAPQPESPQQ